MLPVNPAYAAVIAGVVMSLILEVFKAPTWGGPWKKVLALIFGGGAGYGISTQSGGDPIAAILIAAAGTFAFHSLALQGTSFGLGLQGLARVLHGLPGDPAKVNSKPENPTPGKNP